MMLGPKNVQYSFRDRMQVPNAWRTDLDDPAGADVLVVARGASRTDGCPARANIDRFAELMHMRGAGVVALDAEELCPETACYPGTPEALRQLIWIDPPKTMVVFGEVAACNVGQALSADLPAPRLPGGGIVERDVNGCRVIPMLSLVPPVWNRWERWAWPYLAQVSDHICEHLLLSQRTNMGNATNRMPWRVPYVIAERGRRR